MPRSRHCYRPNTIRCRADTGRARAGREWQVDDIMSVRKPQANLIAAWHAAAAPMSGSRTRLLDHPARLHHPLWRAIRRRSWQRRVDEQD